MHGSDTVLHSRALAAVRDIYMRKLGSYVLIFKRLAKECLYLKTVARMQNLKKKLHIKYSSVFRENRCPQPPKPVYGGHFSHEAVTLKIRSRSPKSNKQLILSDLFRLANLVTFHPMVHNMQTNTFWLNFGGLSLTVTLKIRSRSPKPIQLFIMSKCYIHANLVKSASWFMRYCAHKHLLAQIWQFKSRTDLEK